MGSTEYRAQGKQGTQTAFGSSPGLEGHGGRRQPSTCLPHWRTTHLQPQLEALGNRYPFSFCLPSPLSTCKCPLPQTPFHFVSSASVWLRIVLESVVFKKRLARTRSYERRISEMGEKIVERLWLQTIGKTLHSSDIYCVGGHWPPFPLLFRLFKDTHQGPHTSLRVEQGLYTWRASGLPFFSVSVTGLLQHVWGRVDGFMICFHQINPKAMGTWLKTSPTKRNYREKIALIMQTEANSRKMVVLTLCLPNAYLN